MDSEEIKLVGACIAAAALFAWLISRTFSANKHYFSLTINQPIVLSTMPSQPSEQDDGSAWTNGLWACCLTLLLFILCASDCLSIINIIGWFG